jgi:peptidase E
MYQKYWRDSAFKPFDNPECTDEFILQFLYKKGRVTEIGHALRNKYIEQYYQTLKQYLKTLGVRSIIEGTFRVDKCMGAIKDWEVRT